MRGLARLHKHWISEPRDRLRKRRLQTGSAEGQHKQRRERDSANNSDVNTVRKKEYIS